MELLFEEVSIRSIVSEVTSTFDQLLQQHNNTLSIHFDQDGLKAIADKVRLKQVLYNLLSNANKFTKQGQIILNVLQKSNKNGDWVVLEIKDTGIGMSEEQQSRLFNAFTQADAHIAREYGGTGLGLAISREICRMMGGEIYLDSELGSGSTFIIEIPALTDTQHAAA